MNKYLLILIIFMIISIIVLISYISLSKLKKNKEKYTLLEDNINNDLDSKLKCIINIANDIKKTSKGKDYLEEYLTIKDLNISNIEKDIKLNDAEILINKLLLDNSKLNTAKVKKQLNELRIINEKLTSSKILYNKYTLENNNIIKKFPNNIIAKIFNYKIKSYYTNNKTEDLDNF